jgi:hypothetical protein
MLFFLLTWTECFTLCFFFSDNEDPKKFVATAPVTDAPAVDEPPSQEAAMVPKSPEAAAKKAGSRASKRLKKASAASTSLDALWPVIPTDDVSNIYFYCLLALNYSSYTLPWTDFVEKFISLGNECVKFLKAVRSSHGKLCAILCILFAYLCAYVTHLLSFLLPSYATDDLAVANARILSLEAELKSSRKAWDAATAAKTTAEKSTKSALARAKKAEKALADANKERIQRDQAVTERLNKMSALAGGKYHDLPFFVELPNSDTC